MTFLGFFIYLTLMEYILPEFIVLSYFSWYDAYFMGEVGSQNEDLFRLTPNSVTRYLDVFQILSTVMYVPG